MGRVWFWLESWWHWPGLSGLEGPLPGVWWSSFQFYHQPPVNRIRVKWFSPLGKVTVSQARPAPFYHLDSEEVKVGMALYLLVATSIF